MPPFIYTGTYVARRVSVSISGGKTDADGLRSQFMKACFSDAVEIAVKILRFLVIPMDPPVGVSLVQK